jgi:nicotinate dehydrogenase subunit B
MAGVVSQLSTAADEDIRAIAHYLSSINESANIKNPIELAQVPVKEVLNSGQRIFEFACGACHQPQSQNLNLSSEAGSNVPLQFNSQLHSNTPNNLIRTILEGVKTPATQSVGYMPGFKHQLADEQISDLVAYMREHFAPKKSQWQNIAAQVKSLRE